MREAGGWPVANIFIPFLSSFMGGNYKKTEHSSQSDVIDCLSSVPSRKMKGRDKPSFLLDTSLEGDNQKCPVEKTAQAALFRNISFFSLRKRAVCDLPFDDPERVPSPRIRVAEGKIAMPSFLVSFHPKKTA